MADEDTQRSYAIELARELKAAGVRSFSCCGSFSLATHSQPMIEVEGLGEGLVLPLSPAAAESLKAVCEQAPFGRGEQTVVDTQVRHTWQLGTDKFNVVASSNWLRTLGELLEGVCSGLGITDTIRVEAQPYKLLLYEQGSFFGPHKDTEKVPGMFGTLVVQLPSAFQGGDLHVRHAGQQHVYGATQLAPSISSMSYVAFYADCEHEVKPLTQGYRLCLTYNLRLAGSSASAGLTAPPTSPDVVSRLASLCEQWEADETGPTFLVYMLEHRYTQQGCRGIAALKGNDITRAQLLIQLSERTGAGVALVCARCHESGNGGDDDSTWSSDDYDILDITYSIDHWSMLAGQPLEGLGRMTIEKDQMLPPNVFDELKPDREENEGPTGNEGAPVDRWYRHAALVLWPASHRQHVIAKSRAGPLLLVRELTSRVEELQQQCAQAPVPPDQQQLPQQSDASPSQEQQQQQSDATHTQQLEAPVQLPADVLSHLTVLCSAVVRTLGSGLYRHPDHDHDPWDHHSSDSSGAGLAPRKYGCRGLRAPDPGTLQQLLPALRGLTRLGLQQEVGELMLAATAHAGQARGQEDVDVDVLLHLFKQDIIPAWGWAVAEPWLKAVAAQGLGPLHQSGPDDFFGDSWAGRGEGNVSGWQPGGYGCNWAVKVWESPIARLLMGLLDVQPLHMGPAAAAAQPAVAASVGGHPAAAAAAATLLTAAGASMPAAGAGCLSLCAQQVQQVAGQPAEAVSALRAVAKQLFTEGLSYAKHTQVGSLGAVTGELVAGFQLLTLLGMTRDLQRFLCTMHISGDDSRQGQAAVAAAAATPAVTRRSSRIKQTTRPIADVSRTGLSAADAYTAAVALAPVAVRIGDWLGADLCKQTTSSADPAADAQLEAWAETCSAAASCYRALAGFCCDGLWPKVSEGAPSQANMFVLPTDAMLPCDPTHPGKPPCANCSEALKFLQDGSQSRWCVVAGRLHVESVLRRVPGLELSVCRQVRPSKLVVDKTGAHFMAQLAVYQQAKALLDSITAQTGNPPQVAAAAAAVAGGDGAAGSPATGGRRRSQRSAASPAAAASAGGGAEGGVGRSSRQGRGEKRQAQGSAAAEAEQEAAAAAATANVRPKKQRIPSVAPTHFIKVAME